jgi:predicted nucleic acid-binding protein
MITDYSTTDALRSVLDIARRYRLTAYDAAYLELAMRQGLALATEDSDLRRAAGDVGVPLFEPA